MASARLPYRDDGWMGLLRALYFIEIMKDEINKQNRTGFFRLVYIVGDFGGTFYFSFK